MARGSFNWRGLAIQLGLVEVSVTFVFLRKCRPSRRRHPSSLSSCHSAFLIFPCASQVNVPKASVSGTKADLRTLSLEKAKEFLLKRFDMTEESIENLDRWKLIDLVRDKSSSAAAGCDDPDLTQFARGRRFNFHQQQQAYKDNCARIFEKQLGFLGALAPDDISDDEDDDLQDNIELQDFAGEIERELEAVFGEDSNPEPTEPAPTTSTKLSSSRALRLLGFRKKQQQEDAEEIEAERRELQKFREEARESKCEEALRQQPTSTSGEAVRASPDGQTRAAAPSPAMVEMKKEPFSPLSENSLDTFSENSLPGGSPPPGGAAGGGGTKRKYLKRTVTKKGPDGKEIKVVEIIRDPKMVEEYLNKSKSSKKNRPKLTAEEEAEKLRVRKEKRRLQEQLRRLRKNLGQQEILRERLAEGSRDGTLSSMDGANNQLVCGACGMLGHMRTNRNCPKYTEDHNPPSLRSSSASTPSTSAMAEKKSNKKRRKRPRVEDEQEPEGPDYESEDSKVPALPAGLVKVEGTKLRFHKAVLSAVSATTPTAAPDAAVRPPKRPKSDISAPTSAPGTPATPAAVAPPADAAATAESPSQLLLRIPKTALPKSSPQTRKPPVSEPNYMTQPSKLSR